MEMSDLILATLGIALGGFLKGATGAGAPVVGIPILALIFDVQKAVAIFAVLNLCSNIWQCWEYRAHIAPKRFMVPFAITGALGAASGTVLLARLSTDVLMGGIAVIVFLYIALRLARPDWKLSRATGNLLAGPAGFVAGIMQGAGGISAPVSITFLNALRFERNEFIATISVYFLAMTALQIPTLVTLGILTPERFGLAVLAIIPMFGAMPIGEWAAKRVSKAAFDKLILALLAAIAMRLTYSAIF